MADQHEQLVFKITTARGTFCKQACNVHVAQNPEGAEIESSLTTRHRFSNFVSARGQPKKKTCHGFSLTCATASILAFVCAQQDECVLGILIPIYKQVFVSLFLMQLPAVKCGLDVVVLDRPCHCLAEELHSGSVQQPSQGYPLQYPHANELCGQGSWKATIKWLPHPVLLWERSSSW